ncbi:GYF domain-containing protein [Blastomyces dermatitidis ER-3]|uniref:GYF domain-containing protein n=1 Tax=Ajellomyces dermatitidis (strain ER-3 / ATCC MYA-2586) TaxID=559297 RepID=A0ABP2F5X0_AJEDR|nr:GYF domain-containing protein [Blastomyces dermatitidis ER-3]EEQ92486.1 GYF domain-containing protein [Blastomyces dermatitidis ER-3]
MPSPLPSSFASAAAGNAHDSGLRKDGIGGGEWSRTRMNGATQTFRRPSLATNNSHTRETAQTTSSTSTPPVAAYIPPHLSSNYQPSSPRSNPNDSRYSKDQLLNLYKSQQDPGSWGKHISDYFMADWNPRDEIPTSVNGSWTKREDMNDGTTGPEVCWDHSGQVQPLALTEMNDEEKDLFSGSVNSPLKPPPQSGSKDASGAVNIARKGSVSHSQSHLGSFNTSSPGSARTVPRRRGTGDSSGNPMSPTGTSRFFRDDITISTPPPSLLRRKTDFREAEAKLDERDKENSGRDADLGISSPFGTLKRSTTGPIGTSSNASTSPWPSSSHGSAFSPMGAFGNFSLGPMSGSAGASDKKSGFGSLRGESRFKGLLSKDSSEDIGSSIKEKSSLSALDRLPEVEDSSPPPPQQQQLPWGEGIKTRPARSETNPFGDEPRSGSAALGGQDLDAPATSTSAPGIDQFGLSFGMASSGPTFRDIVNQQSQPAQTPNHHAHEPMSPTNTNPYQSPHGERADTDDIDTDGSDIQHAHLPGLSDIPEDPGMSGFGSIRRGGSTVDASAGDRSQTSSVGAGRGFPNLTGLGGMSSLGSAGGWPTSAASGTPTRERTGFGSGFGDPIFGSMADLQSPSLATLGGGGFFGSHTSLPSASRTSKMGSLFPPAMQDQMRGEQARPDSTGIESSMRQQGDNRNVSSTSPFDTGITRRDTDQATRSGGLFSPLGGIDLGREAFLSGDKPGPGSQPISVPSSQPPAPSTTAQSSIPPSQSSADGTSQPGQSHSSASSSNTQLPTSQQRQMVMPDRMRWIYRDPQGNTQGPWSGLEMHDWFKAGFFTAELQVKKLEDAEYEPLAQLVRRIGNSREPFLVPQIGVAHGPPSNQTGPWGASASQSGVAQPPFPTSFPSFGTTLTADQQNALERRKQEEQYLMARQKEHLAQQQVLMKQMAMQNTPHTTMHPQLQHHSSAHSLHSQPSFGSITSPGGYQPSPIQGPIQPPQAVPGYFEPAMRQPNMPNVPPQMLPQDMMAGQEELPSLVDRLNINRQSQFPFNTGPSFGARQQENVAQSQQVATMLQDRARLQQEQEQFDKAKGDSMFDQQARDERLRQFHALRRQTDDDIVRRTEGLPTHPPTMPAGDEFERHDDISKPGMQQPPKQEHTQQRGQEPLSLSQQVQKAASAQRQRQHQQQQQTQTPTVQTESPWAKVDSGMPQPFPPPPSQSPLPAPAAQRNRQNVADTLAASSRSQNQTPIETPTTSIAPWAKETIEAPRGPSLKEIQEAEARKAAKLEEAAAAARRALAEQERANQPPAPAPGLPSTANWASSGSPATPPSAAGSVWAKQPGGGKPQPSATVSAPKKTLAQIQKEEEARKQRLTVVNNPQAAAAVSSPVASAGKRYADLASKVASPTAPAGAWTTVGAGGKAKPPPTAPAGLRTIPVAPAAAAKPRPTVLTRPSTLGSAQVTNTNKPVEELMKWAKNALGKGLNSSINVDDFVQQLLLLPPETEIISDSVYANSQTLDGRRFAEEFVRRRKLADKGVVDPASLNAGSNGFGTVPDSNGSDGWNEVAKKGSQSAAHREDTSNAPFKVVAAKKKGKR